MSNFSCVKRFRSNFVDEEENFHIDWKIRRIGAQPISPLSRRELDQIKLAYN